MYQIIEFILWLATPVAVTTFHLMLRLLRSGQGLNIRLGVTDSNPKKAYQALHYTDGSTSCDCPGWTRRVQSDGSRTCKHVREIQAGTARHSCSGFVGNLQPLPQLKPIHAAKPVVAQQNLPGRVFDLD